MGMPLVGNARWQAAAGGFPSSNPFFVELFDEKCVLQDGACALLIRCIEIDRARGKTGKH
jgi:hypothetical protein